MGGGGGGGGVGQLLGMTFVLVAHEEINLVTAWCSRVCSFSAWVDGFASAKCQMYRLFCGGSSGRTHAVVLSGCPFLERDKFGRVLMPRSRMLGASGKVKADPRWKLHVLRIDLRGQWIAFWGWANDSIEVSRRVLGS